MDLVRPVSRVSQQIDTYSISNKETEDFKRALAENVGSKSSTTTIIHSDPTFSLIIRLLKESQHPSARDMLNYYYVSCDASLEAIEYFYSQAKTGDAVARVQLGKLCREGKLANSALEVQVVAEAFASQHELAMFKLENQVAAASTDSDVALANFTNSTKSVPSERSDINTSIESISDRPSESSFDETSPHRPQHSAIRRIETVVTNEPLTSKEVDQKASKLDIKPTTKSKNKRSKSNSKAKRAKELVNG